MVLNLEEKLELRDRLSSLEKYRNRSFGLGLLVGVLITTAAFSGFMYWNSLDHRVNVPVTVVTCDNCSYGKFQNATDRMFKASYREVDYRSEKGQKLVEKYSINYVPAFIFDKKIEKADAFYRVKSTLVKFDDAYVIPDKGRRVAQRLSEGKQLN